MLCDLQIFSGGVYPSAQPHTQTLFLFPIVFGINIIREGRKEGVGSVPKVLRVLL